MTHQWSWNIRQNRGTVYDHKRFGEWEVETGYYKNDKKEKGNSWSEFYFYDYKIPNVQRFSHSIFFKAENKSLTCYFKWLLKADEPATNFRLDYLYESVQNTIFVNCTVMDGCEVFSTTSGKLHEELKVLLEGLYNRKIFHCSKKSLYDIT